MKYNTDRVKMINWSFEEVPVGSVTAGGEIGRRMALAADKILHHMDLDGVFLEPFRNRRAEPAVPGGFAGSGMLLDALVKAAAQGVGGDEMRRCKERFLAALTAAQSEDGAITIFRDGPGFWDNHDQAYMIQGLVRDFLWFGNASSLEAAVRLGRFLIGRRSGVTLGLEQAFLMLGEVSGDSRYLEYCRREFRIAEPLDVYDRLTEVNGNAHVYTMTARVLAQLEYARLTGDFNPAVSDGIRQLYDRVLRGGFSSVTGSCSGGIFWGEIWDDSQIGLGRWGETCASAYLMRLSAAMTAMTGETIYGDLFERICFNAFFGAQSADGLRYRYFSPFNEPGDWYDRDSYCCPNNFRRMVFELPQAVYFRAPDGVVVNLYTDSAYRDGSFRILQRTAYPLDGEVHLTVDAPEGSVMRFRIPRWCADPVVRHGGREFHPEPGTLFALRGGWRREPLVELSFPMPVRLVRGSRAQAGRVAVMRGPLVYALEQERNRLPRVLLDVLAIGDGGRFVPEEEAIRFNCTEEFRSRQQRTVSFTRFSEENRSRTFFPLLPGAAPTVEDELYRSTVDSSRG